MKRVFVIPAILFCLCIALPNLAGASGYSLGILMDDGETSVIALAKFRSSDFLRSEVDTLASQLKQAVQAYGYGPEVSVYNHSDLGDPDTLRPALQSFTDDYEIVFLEVSKGAAPVSGAPSGNIWVDMSYENMGSVYVGSLGLQEWLLNMTN